MNSQSIHFRLIVWYAGVLLLVLLGFGAFTYTTLRFFGNQVLGESMAHRAQQIADLVTSNPAGKDPQYVSREIVKRYDPATNDRFVRVSRSDGQILFLSDEPNDRSFAPQEIPVWQRKAEKPTTYMVVAPGGTRLLVAAQRVQARNNTFLIEVGGTLTSNEQLLQRLLLTLLLGLPVVLAVVIFGGYVLTKRALQPVQTMMRAAQEITLSQLSRRLPALNSDDEVAHLAAVLNQMIARLDESFQNTARFTADASHELRTPLTIIRGELEAILLDRKLEPDLRDSLASLLEEAERLVRIVEGLFALSRLDSGEAQTERVRFDLAKLAETTAEQMCLLAEVKHIDLVYETSHCVEIEGDRSRLKQVVVNLLDNAIKYTPEHGRVSLAVRSQNGSALLEVSDTGPGVSETALPHLFERFYRADEVRSREIGGAGLGLSIIQSICTAHGGGVTAANTPPSGCRFTVELPLAHKS
ncbi:heavy metal sensor kinase [Chthoniobacter flavus]|uniref:sensor histidine kinase n=1 Tax=Chthoniobacter flavus TaxID=191863 RepID=UPI001048A670|nr:HAMP domain-containing sensor histidine kinase [Chthoniobacter flavus]TCO94719.1 heavy metal sensor kinase [Chthoniobacter flavus]